MTGEIFNSNEPTRETAEHRPLEQLAIELAELDPKPIANFTPDNLDEVLGDFLSGKSRNPDGGTYSKLDAIDFVDKATHYQKLLAEVLVHPEIPQKHQHVYVSFVERTLSINELMHQAALCRTSSTQRQREQAENRFMELNRKLYGEPDPVVAAAMVEEVLEDTQNTNDSQLAKIRQEFIDLLPEGFMLSPETPVKLRPSKEAQEYVARIVEYAYRPLLKHADETITTAKTDNTPENKLRFGPSEIADLFQTIIDKEFPDSGWKVEICDANAIFADSATKTVRVPEDRKPVSANKLRGLVVHELGVHMLRSIMGEKADLIPLRYGLAGYKESEEGLATMAESVITGNPERTGYQHYLTAALLTRGIDFRDTYEVMWRYKVLDSYLDKKKDVEVNEAFIESKKTAAAKFMIRSIRGTNYLPWYTVLNYRNGAAKMWEYIENHIDSPELLFLLFAGKVDPTEHDHVRGIFDALSRVKV